MACKVVIGTTDLPTSRAEMEPGHESSEISFLLETINPFLKTPIDEKDILSIFSGLRPLVTGASATTSKLSREHHIDASASGLITVAGGKWTTYRRMAEDTIDFAIKKQMLPRKICRTREVALHAAPAVNRVDHSSLGRYGTDAEQVLSLAGENPVLSETMDAALPFLLAEAVYSVRYEMARTVEDVLSRRTRALLLDAKAARRAAPSVARVMAAELGFPPRWVEEQVAEFNRLALLYYVQSSSNPAEGASTKTVTTAH